MAEKRLVEFKLSTDASGAIRGLKSAGDALTGLESRTKSLGAMIQTHWKGFAAAIGGALAGREIVDFAKRSIAAADEMNKLSQITGTTVEQISALGYAARLSDVSQESLSTGLKKLSKNAYDAASGTGEAKDAFLAMGISVVDAGGGLKTTANILEDVAGKFSQYEDSAAKTALAQRLFGKSGADLIPMLNQGKQGLADMASEAEKMGLVLSKQTAQDAENFNDNMTRLKAVLEGFANKTMAELLPLMERYSKELVSSASNSGSLDRASKNAAATLVSVAEKVKTLVELYGSIPPELTEAGAYGLIGLMLFGGKAGAIIASLTLINDLASKSLNFGVQDFGKKWAGYSQSVQNIWDVISGKRDWNTGQLKGSTAIGVDYEPHGGYSAASRNGPAPLLPDTASIGEYKKAQDALRSYQRQVEGMDPSLSQFDKQQQGLAQSAADLIKQYAKYPSVVSGVQKALGLGEGFINLQRQMDANEELVKLSEDVAKAKAETTRNELDNALMLLNIDTRRFSATLDHEQQLLAIRARYGELSSAEAAQRGFDIEVEKLRIQDQAIAATIRERSERALIDEDAKGILELLLQQKEVEDEINRLLGVRSIVLREHTGSMGEGFGVGWQKYFDSLGSEFQRGEDYARDAASAMHKAFEDFFFDPMSFSWDSLWLSMQRVSARAMSDIMVNLFNQLARLGINSFSNLFNPGGQNIGLGNSVDLFSFHKGGIVGDVPRLHGGLLPGEYPAILQRGEGVFTPGQMKAMGGQVTVNITNNSGAVATTETRQNAAGVEIDVIIDRAVASKLSTFGAESNKAVRRNFTASQRLTRR